MTLKYNITSNDGDPSSVTVFNGPKMYSATAEHPAFNDIIANLKGERGPVEPEVITGLFDVGEALGNVFVPLSERVSINGGRIFFDNDPLIDGIADMIVKFHSSGAGDYMALVNFLEKISINPNPHSREHLYRWLDKHSFGICPDGDFIAYKGVIRHGTEEDPSYYSSSSGTALVNGVRHVGAIPNKPGTVVEMPRGDVQFDPRVGCSTGLHAGSWSYARDFTGGTVLRVKINPRDVVSVPVDANDQKLRVCRYRVLDRVYEQDNTAFYPNAEIRTLVARATEYKPVIVATETETIYNDEAEAPAPSPAPRPSIRTRKPAPRKAAPPTKKAAPTVGKKAPAKKAATPKAAPTKKAAAPTKAPAPAKKVVAPKYYEEYTKADFVATAFNTLRWLAKEWDIKGLTVPVTKDALVAKLTREAKKRLGLATGNKKFKKTGLKK